MRTPLVLTMLRPLWAYRGFILGSVKREFQSKYRKSVLGAVWPLVHPLAQIIVYTVVFSQIIGAKLPGVESSLAYGIYLCAGILTWGLFAEIVIRSQTIFLDNANMLKKINFPRLSLPTVVVLNALVNFAIIFGLFSLFLVVSGNFPGIFFLGLLPLLVVQVAFAIGLGVTVGILNVFFRDVGQFFGVLLTFWFWMTPIVYPVTILPEGMQSALDWNPMTGLIGGYQSIVVFGEWPRWEELWLITVLAVLLCVLAVSLFHRHGGELVDEL
jgi:lipopolysaccharide transport system permease protein